MKPHNEIVMRVRFKSDLTLEEVSEIVEQRAPDFEALVGLKQKYYLQDMGSGEYAGLYVWDSPESLRQFRESELKTTIGRAYQTKGEPDIEVYRVIKILRDEGE